MVGCATVSDGKREIERQAGLHCTALHCTPPVQGVLLERERERERGAAGLLWLLPRTGRG